MRFRHPVSDTPGAAGGAARLARRSVVPSYTARRFSDTPDTVRAQAMNSFPCRLAAETPNPAL
jgi:hypothetical protein